MRAFPLLPVCLAICAILLFGCTQAQPPKDKLGETFTGEQKLVAAYFYYWYPVPEMGELRDAPPEGKPFGYSDVAWFKRELSDMEDAGIDIALVSWWGKDKETEHWSYIGLQNLVQAREELIAEGGKPPKLAMFFDAIYDTYPDTVPKDMSTEEGKRFFYRHIYNFYSRVPKEHWARIDGKPITWFFSSGFGMKATQEGFDYFTQRFAQDFNETPLVVLARGCTGNNCEFAGISSGLGFVWGAAPFGTQYESVNQVGPGYDDFTKHAGNIVRDRENGFFYAQSWRSAISDALQNNKKIIALETWNELYEGSEVCDTARYGRAYIELTKKYSDYFRQGVVPPEPVPKLRAVGFVSAALGKNPQFSGITVPYLQGMLFETHGGKECVSPKPNTTGTISPIGGGIANYLAPLDIGVADTFALAGPAGYSLEIEFFADTDKHFFVYAPELIGEFSAAATGGWETVSVPLPLARFRHEGSLGTDIRIEIEKTGLCISGIELRRA
ncbi:MAG: hypothetical protein V1676_03310 [Candidatus Diapherotrites archaeon]